MAIAINGSGTITGVSVGGLPDGIVDADTLASNSVEAAKIAANAVITAKIADGAATGPKRGAGAILQVVTDSDSGQSTTNSNSWNWQGLDVTITPASSSNKILVICNLAMDGGSNQAFMTLYRGNDNLGGSEGFGAAQNSSRCISGLHYLDSPNTTSATQYRIACRNGNNSTTVEVPPWSNGRQTLTALEIQG